MDIHIINACLPLKGKDKLYTLKASAGVWTAVDMQDKQIDDPSFNLPDRATAAGKQTANKLNAAGRIILPGLVDAHVHLDKAFTIESAGNESGTLMEAIRNFRRVSPSFSKETIKQRMRKTVKHAVSFGTTAMRSHLDFNMADGGRMARNTFEAALEVKEEMKGLADLQFFPMVDFTRLCEKGSDLLEEAMKQGMDGVGGAPHLSENPESHLGQLFDFAERWGREIDLHSDETDDPDVETVRLIAGQTVRSGYTGMVAAGHLCSLSAMAGQKAEKIIEEIHEAGLNVITLPGANMYLQGRNDSGLIRRGVTRVKELKRAGVSVSAASDNIQDPFHPYGKGDLIEIGRLSSYAAHMSSEAEKTEVLKMITEVPARTIGLAQYGLKAGHPASFTIFDACTVNSLLAWAPVGRWVFKNGQCVCVTKQIQNWCEEETFLQHEGSYQNGGVGLG